MQPGFRDYGSAAPARVRETYRLNHERQTHAFARAKRAEFGTLDRARLGVWEALERLDELVDESDPDTEQSQLQHALQTAERIRRDGHPEWLVLTGLVHDLGKLLCLFGEPQWAVVGDTFPTGCRHDPAIVHHDLFATNPDRDDPVLGSEIGVYSAGCGFDALTMSWGHDEYLYLVLREHLPEEAAYVLRYHSFYAAHSAGRYAVFQDDRDRRLLPWVQRFQPYDLYSKGEAPVDVPAVRPFYEDLVARHLPATLAW